MKHGLKALLIASTIAVVPLVSAAPAEARARVGVVLNLGDIAFGYNDGYWDRDHRWHRWHNPQERYRYRVYYREHYYDRDHDRDRNYGWRDHDRYWNHDRRDPDFDRDHDHRGRDHRG